MVGEVELDFIEREIGERDVLRVNDIVVAVVASEGGGAVRVDFEFPDLEFLDRHVDLLQLADCDCIQEPVSPALVGEVFRAVGEETRRLMP